MTYLIIALTAIVSYLIGSVNFSILLSKMLSGKDIRESGSGNAGATNMLRTYGKKMGVITLLLDVLKGIVVILLSRLVKNIAGTDEIYPVISYIAGVCVILGHNFPLYFGFKGGKGVATSLGVVLMLDWKVGLIVAVVAIAVMAVTRYVSLGSILGGAMYIVIEIVKMIVTKSVDVIQLVCVIFFISCNLEGKCCCFACVLLGGCGNGNLTGIDAGHFTVCIHFGNLVIRGFPGDGCICIGRIRSDGKLNRGSFLTAVCTGYFNAL